MRKFFITFIMVDFPIDSCLDKKKIAIGFDCQSNEPVKSLEIKPYNCHYFKKIIATV